MHNLFSPKQAKSCVGISVAWWLIGVVESVAGVGLRPNGKYPVTIETSSSSASTPPASSHPLSEYISEQNLYGIIVLSLVAVLLLISCLYQGSVVQRKYRILIHSITLLEDKDDVAIPAEGLSAVVKLNSLNPIHFVLPISSKEHSDECEFEVQEKALRSLTFSLVVRDGNIPIHFEGVELGALFLKWKSLPKGGETTMTFETERLTKPDTDAKLKNRIIQIHYAIRGAGR